MRLKPANVVLGLLFIGGIGYYLFTGSQVQRFCAALPVGSSLVQVQELTVARGYHVGPLTDNRAIIRNPQSVGRFFCVVNFGSNGLESTSYVHNP
jgi:hypothetical protein